MQGSKKIVKSLLIMALLSAAGCYTSTAIHPKHGTAGDQIHAELLYSTAIDKKIAKQSGQIPLSVSNALIPSMDASIPKPAPPRDRQFVVTANQMPARAFFMGLVEGTPYNMIVSPAVTGTISLNLRNVTIDQTLEAVQDAYGYEFRKTSYGYEILPAELETKIFTINYLDVRRSGKSYTELSSGAISEKIGTVTAGSSNNSGSSSTSTPLVKPSGSSVETRSIVNFWRDLDSTLKTMVGNKNGRSVVVNPQAGIVIVHAFPAEIHQVDRYLIRIQNSLSRQVILEAKILEVQLNDQYQAGIDWNLIGDAVNADIPPTDGGVAQTAFKTFDKTDLKDFDSIFTLRIKGDFGGLIKLLQTQGNVQVLSSPRISTINNQKAVIKVGQDEFFVTGVSTSTVVTGASTVPTQDIDLTPFFSGVNLDVTPQISNDGSVVLHIHPSVSTVKDQTKNIILGSTPTTTSTLTTTETTTQNNIYRLPLALSTIRESDNIVRARSGQVVVIGGLMQNTMKEEIAGIPVLSKIPVIGPAFRRTRQIAEKTELVILLRPIIAEKQAWTNDLEESDRTFGNMKRGFHAGGLPEVFGNEAEPDLATSKKYKR